MWLSAFVERIGDVCDMVVYPDAQLKQVEVYGTTPLFLTRLCTFNSQAVVGSSHLFFVVMKASSLSLQTPPIQDFPFFTP